MAEKKESKKIEKQKPSVKFAGQEWKLVDIAGQTIAIEKDGTRINVLMSSVELNDAAKELIAK